MRSEVSNLRRALELMVFTPNQNWISQSKKNVTSERPSASLPTLARWWERLRISLVPDCESIKVCALLQKATLAGHTERFGWRRRSTLSESAVTPDRFSRRLAEGLGGNPHVFEFCVRFGHRRMKGAERIRCKHLRRSCQGRRGRCFH